jgi:hypothetical protein
VKVVGCYESEYGWLVERAGCELTTGFKAIKAVDDTGRIHGMIGYGAWTVNSCLMHIALENPAAFRSLLPWAFEYPFNQCGRNVAFATVRAENRRSHRLCMHIGMKEVFRMKDAVCIGEDMVIFEMRKEWCPWLQERKAA